MSASGEVLTTGAVTSFIKKHYRHFNAAVVIDASEAYVRHLSSGGQMFVTLGGRNEHG